MLSANRQSAWAKIKVLVDAAGPAKSIQHCKDKIKYLKDTCKQAKDNNKKSGSATQTSAYLQDFDQVLGQEGRLAQRISVEEGLLLSDWDKNEPLENNFDSETSSSNQQNMENKSGNIVSSRTGRNLKISRYLGKLCDQNVTCFIKKN